MFYNYSKAQGTIEYLVIVATIVVIALIAVGLFITLSSSPSQQVIDSSSKIGDVSSGGISIVESVVDADGNSLIFLVNNSSDGITLKKISVGGVDNNYNNLIVGLDPNVVSLSGLSSACPCVSGQKTAKCEFKFEYLTATGLMKTEYRTINVQCVSSARATNGSRVVNPIVIEDEPVVHLCGEIATLPVGYQEISTCSDIISGGNYILFNNLNCSLSGLTIVANDVNINGNYCTIDGSISASRTDNDGASGYSSYTNLKLNNVTLNGSITSTGADAVSMNGGNGGSISLVSSKINGSISSTGAIGYEAHGGSSGVITLVDSNLLGSITSIGGEQVGYGEAGASGLISLISSNIEGSITSTGGYGGDGTGGATGSIILSDSIATTIESTAGDGGMSNASGLITLADSTADSITSTGGSNNHSNGASPSGSISINNSLINGGITSIGGHSYSYVGGASGAITITGALTEIGACNAIGGASTLGQGGLGGNITISATCPTLSNIGAFNCSGGLGSPNGTAGTCPHTC